MYLKVTRWKKLPSRFSVMGLWWKYTSKSFEHKSVFWYLHLQDLNHLELGCHLWNKNSTEVDILQDHTSPPDLLVVQWQALELKNFMIFRKICYLYEKYEKRKILTGGNGPTPSFVLESTEFGNIIKIEPRGAPIYIWITIYTLKKISKTDNIKIILVSLKKSGY